jgi:hypothetical protein
MATYHTRHPQHYVTHPNPAPAMTGTLPKDAPLPEQGRREFGRRVVPEGTLRATYD